MTTGVQLIDVSELEAGHDRRKKCIDALIQSFRDYGFVRLNNHGVSSQSVQHIFSMAERMFSMANAEKLEFANIADGRPQRGYSAVGVEKTASLHGKLLGKKVDETLTDAREHFDCGSPLDREFENVWPSKITGFKERMEEFYFEMEKATADILGWLEEGLEVPQGTFNQLITHEGNASELRLNHYPPIQSTELQSGNVARIWPHFDLGVITLLFTSSVGGLQVEDRKAPEPRTFIPVEPEQPTELIVNVSETLQRWTDDQLPAGLHRVTVPQGMKSPGDGSGNFEIPRRYSIAYLCKADRQAPVGTIAEFQTGDSPRYKNMTASEYHRSRLLEAY